MLAVGGLAAVAALGSDGMADAATSCTPATRVEIITDDSGSAPIYDSVQSRVEAIKLLLGKAANRGNASYGAVEFGQAASTLFGPTPVKTGNVAGLQSAVEARTQDDGSGAPVPGASPPRDDRGVGTNYDAAFAGAANDHPNANARVFLTEGDHNEGAYDSGHLGGPPTHVIGYGASTDGENLARLQAIAGDTKGQFSPSADPTNLTSVANGVDSRLSCASRPGSFTDTFYKARQSKAHRIDVGTNTSAVELTVLWKDFHNRFDLVALRLVRKGRVIASARRRRPAELRLKGQRGVTFQTVRVSGGALSRGGRLRFTVRSRVLPAPSRQVTTAVAQFRRGR